MPYAEQFYFNTPNPPTGFAIHCSSVTRHSMSVFDYTVMEHKDGEGDKAVTMKTILDRRAHTVKALKGIIINTNTELLEEHKSAWHQVRL